jgi:hypothetical protein
MIIIVVVSLQLPVYEELLLQRISDFTAALGNIGIDVQAAATLPNKSAAGLLLIEQTWAIGLRDAMKHAGGVRIAGGLVAPDVLQELEEELEMAKQQVG